MNNANINSKTAEKNNSNDPENSLDGATPLHFAAFYGHLDIVKILVENKAELECENIRYETALFISIDKEHEDISKYLIQKGANVNLTVPDRSGPLFMAICNGQVNVVKLLLQNGSKEVNLECIMNEEESCMPLETAIWKNSLEIVTALLEHGADPNHLTNNPDAYYFPAIDQALKIANLEIVQMMLKHGADADLFLERAMKQTDIYNKFEIDLEEEEGIERENIILAFLNHGANCTIWEAIESKYVDIVKALLMHGAETDVVNSQEMTPLHITIEKHYTKMSTLLIQFGADVNARDPNSKTPLHYLYEHGTGEFFNPIEEFQLLEYLIQYGANPNLKDDEGDSVIEHILYHEDETYFKTIVFQCHLC